MAKKKVVATHGTVSEVENDKITQTKGKVLKFEGDPAVVRVSVGATLNTGNYTSLRLGVDVSLPCYPEKIEETFKKAEKFASHHLTQMIAKKAPKEDEVEEVEDSEFVV